MKLDSHLNTGEGGIYGEECKSLRRKLDAHIVVLLVAGGKKGSGFSLEIGAADDAQATEMAKSLVKALQHIAQRVEAQIEEKTFQWHPDSE